MGLWGVAREGSKEVVASTRAKQPGLSFTKSWSILSAVKGLTVTVAAYSMGTSLRTLCHTLWCLTMYVCHVPAEGSQVQLLVASARDKTRVITEGRRGRYDPIAGGERGGDGGAEGVDLPHPLVPSDGAGQRRPDGVDALDAVDVGGVDGGGQHPYADVAVPEVDGRHIRHPEHLVGGPVLVVEHGLGRRRD